MTDTLTEGQKLEKKINTSGFEAPVDPPAEWRQIFNDVWRLERDYFGMHRFEWRGPTGAVEVIEFRIGHGEMVRLLRTSGFEIEDLIEIRPPADATSGSPTVTTAWARRWPAEEIWKARKR